ncbi:MAG TPA: DNA polymerase IV [Burkholderiales bacterium]|nr:DNA polymerase IV [Burkholderiales bacterium]
MPPRFIAHLDMDAFYASVELLRYPQLRGKPVVIGGRRRSAEAPSIPTLREYAGRGVITTATYEARVFGLHSGMALMKAKKLAPDTLLLPADFDEYRRYSRMFKDAVRALAPQIEDRGIDEIYIDLTELVASDPAGDAADAWARAREIAAAIQRVVREATGLSCSIGITPNKLLSKIASDLEKPGGLTVLREDDIPTRIWPLPVRKVNGIGPKASARLAAFGINTIGELALADEALLIERFGKSYGSWMHEAAHGRDERNIVTYREPKSISRETTFETDLHPVHDREQLSQVFTELCLRLAGDLERKGYRGKTIGLKLRYDNFKTVTRDHTIEVPTGDAEAIRRAAGECLKRVLLDRRIRLLGVRVGALSKPGAQAQPAAAPQPARTPTLFD